MKSPQELCVVHTLHTSSTFSPTAGKIRTNCVQTEVGYRLVDSHFKPMSASFGNYSETFKVLTFCEFISKMRFSSKPFGRGPCWPKMQQRITKTLWARILGAHKRMRAQSVGVYTYERVHYGANVCAHTHTHTHTGPILQSYNSDSILINYIQWFPIYIELWVHRN